MRIPNNKRRMIDSVEQLKTLLHYDPSTGVFVRLAMTRPQSAHYAGKVATGYVKKGDISNGGGYVMMSVAGRRYRAHHIAWFYMTGEWPTSDIDHRDGDRANNRWANLRLATRSQNLGNQRTRRNSRSGVKGVSFDTSRGQWAAQLCGKHIGRFSTKEAAAEAYRIAAERRFGEFARAA